MALFVTTAFITTLSYSSAFAQAVPGSAVQQSASSPSDPKSQEIIVTATKIAEPVQKVAQTVNVVSAAAI